MKRKRISRYVPVTCKRCGGVGMVNQSNAKRQSFCSRACWSAWVREHANPTPNVITYVSAAHEAPEGSPRRYVSDSGYVRLRWKVGTRKYVEAWEHRVAAGAESGESVHHLDRVRDNNVTNNLERIAPSDHAKLHGRERAIANIDVIASEYEAGATLPFLERKYGHSSGTLCRAISRTGVRVRSTGEAGMRRRVSHFDEAAMVECYLSGRGVVMTADRFGVSGVVVQRVLREHGVVLRRPGRPTNAERRERGLL